MSTAYVHVPYPWSAAIDAGSASAASFYVALVGQALRYGRPASRRPGWLWALAARRGIPEPALAAGIRRLRSGSRPDLDELVAAIRQAWPALRGASARLPEHPPPMGVLALKRSAGTTVFVFDESSGALLVVAKAASGRGQAVEREVAALRQAETARVAPRYLGEVGAWRVQQGLEGAPLTPRPLTPERAGQLGWHPALASLGAGLCRLAEATAQPGAPRSVASRLAAALDHARLSPRSRRLLEAASRDIAGLSARVLRHRDTSVQNCLFAGDELTGIVDWEMAEPGGAPAFDVWNATISYVESGIGLVGWSDELALAAFAQAWRHSALWRGAREAGRAAAAAAGVPEAMGEPLEVAFFATRVGDHIELPHVNRGTSIVAAIGMLEVVCEG